MAHLLIVDDDEIFREAVQKNVEAEGHTVTVAIHGKNALVEMAKTKFDVILSDIRMPEMDGVQLLKAIRSKSTIPVILMTGFSEILETQTAHSLGANEFIPKPFTGEDLSLAIARCLNLGPKAPETRDEDFCKLCIGDFISGRAIKFNIFVRLSPNKYVRLAHKGEDIGIDRIRFYREKGLLHLYMRRADFRLYVGFVGTLQNAAPDAARERARSALLTNMNAILHEEIPHAGIDESILESAQTFLSAAFDVLTEDPRTTALMEGLRVHVPHLLPHSIGVSLYATMIAQNLEWNLPANRFKVALGGLFHDVGLKELSPNILARSRYDWTADEVKRYEAHPINGQHLLNKIDGLPEDVRVVIKQHHENCLSRGFPTAMKRASIHPMAKLISVADELCYRIVKGPDCKNLSPAEALNDLRKTANETLDKRFVEALAQLFRCKTAKTHMRMSS